MSEDTQAGGGAADTAVDNNHMNMTADAPTPAPSAPSAPSYAVPEAYKDKSWAKDFKSHEDAYKALDGAQTLIGKKSIVPDLSAASPEDVEAFFSQMRPKDGYGALLGEGVDESYGKMLHDAGLNGVQAAKLVEAYRANEKAQMDKYFSKDDFLSQIKQSFGDSYERDGAATTAFLRENLSAEDVAMMDNIPNDVLAMVYRLSNNIRKAYGGGESGKANAGGQGGGVDLDAKITETRGKIDELVKNPNYTLEQKKALVSELDGYYEMKAKTKGAK